MKFSLKPLLLILGLAATAYAAALLLASEQPHEKAIKSLISWSGLAALCLCLLNYLLRGLRWRSWMATFRDPMKFTEGLRIYLAGYTFTPTPGNLGEAVRGLLLARQPLTSLQSLGVFAAERMADLFGLLLLSIPGAIWLVFSTSISLRYEIRTTVLVSVLIFICLLALVVWKFLKSKFLHLKGIGEAWQCLRQRPWQWIALTVPAWAAQGVAVWLICQQLEFHIDPLQAIGFYALAMVGGAVSMLPAGLGGTEALLTGFFMAAGAGLGQALTITVLVRLLTLWLAVALGLVTLLYSAAIRQDISFR